MNRLIICFCLFVILGCNRHSLVYDPYFVPFMCSPTHKVDSLIAKMSLEEKIGQLIFLKTALKQDRSLDSLYNQVNSGQVGGLWVHDIPLEQYIEIMDSVQKASPFPLFIGSDEKVAMQNQFQGYPNYPKPASIAAIDNTDIQYDIQEQLLKQLATLGINCSFSTTINRADLSASSYNYSLFESDIPSLFQRAADWTSSLQENGILSIGGDFEDYFYIENDTNNIVQKKLNKYNPVIHNGLSGMLVSDHFLQEESLKDWQPYFLQDYLYQQLEFQGLLFGRLSPNATIAELIHVGVDVFIVEDTSELVHQYLVQFVKEKLMTEEVLDQKVRKVLLAKSWLFPEGKNKVINAVKAKKRVHHDKKRLRQNLEEAGIILAQNPNDMLPFKDLLAKDFKIWQYAREPIHSFNETFKKYANFESKLLRPKEETLVVPETNLGDSSHLIIVLDNIDLDAEEDAAFIYTLNKARRMVPVIIINFGNPYNLSYFSKNHTLIQIFEKTDWTASLAAQLLFGGIQAKGRLPLSVSSSLPFNTKNLTAISRIKYTFPEEVDISNLQLINIDSIALQAIAIGATPGCQVVIAKEGKLIFSKSYGHHTYAKEREVKNSHLYDLASITKVMATTLALMRLVEEGKTSLADKISTHLPVPDTSGIKDISIQQLLTHESGLSPHMPIIPYLYYKKNEDNLCGKYYCYEPSIDYCLQVTENMYFDKNYADSIWASVCAMEINELQSYTYSDVNFYILQQIIEKITNKSLDSYLQQQFYEPLALRNCSFNPSKKRDKAYIIPTQYDKIWRKQQIQGYVHDQVAALFGGVGGNAGLFANAEDLTIISQMLMNGGTYGGKRFFSPKTIDLFTQKGHGNHRGLGFNKPAPFNGATGCSGYASSATYGHTGFTGTCVWIDPQQELVYIFLSNRVYPSIFNRKLLKEKVRRRIHQVAYEAIYDMPKIVPQQDTIDYIAVKEETVLPN